jgi:hypothetical protein
MKTDNPYKEAMRYIDNAREMLNKLDNEDGFYNDRKNLKIGCRTAFKGILKALDFLFDIKKVPKKRGRKSIDYYLDNLEEIDRILFLNLNTAYRFLYLGGVNSIKVIEAAFDCAFDIIDALKPYSNNGNE